jgi:hypothetical protein
MHAGKAEKSDFAAVAMLHRKVRIRFCDRAPRKFFARRCFDHLALAAFLQISIRRTLVNFAERA